MGAVSVHVMDALILLFVDVAGLYQVSFAAMDVGPRGIVNKGPCAIRRPKVHDQAGFSRGIEIPGRHPGNRAAS